ncbi:MAG: folylpolyglutamate synthase/dihydrofolate synthase family protein [Ignavibacteriaceae bacterium]
MNIEIQKTLDRLFALHTFGIKLGLDNIVKFLGPLDNPQNSLKTFHIAGSNGKGSTAAFTASILQEAGFKTGLYTSPHFVRFNERIKINGTEVPDNFIADFYSGNEKFISENKLTFFEVTTAMAFQYFSEQNVDFAVIETGLGGRLDATNVLNPLAVIITSISLEHTNILGTTIDLIAAEKAAIIKENSKVFTGLLPEEADKVISEKCKEKKCELFRIEEYSNQKGGTIELYTEEIELDDWTMPLRGDYQKYNAALAALAVSKTLNIDSTRHITDGIKNVVANTGLQGRYEYFSRKPDIIFDSAHNPEGIRNFLSEFSKDKNLYSYKEVIFGVMKDKAVEDMILQLKSAFDNILLTSFDYERACSLNDLQLICGKLNIDYRALTNPADYIKDFKKRKPDNCLVVLGSMFLLGEIKSKLIK